MSADAHGTQRWSAWVVLLVAVATAVVSLCCGAWPAHQTSQAAPWRDLGQRIDVNSADEADLQLLPGIGPNLAHRIVTRRESVGPFVSVEELLEITQVGPRTLEQIRPWVVCGSAPRTDGTVPLSSGP